MDDIETDVIHPEAMQSSPGAGHKRTHNSHSSEGATQDYSQGYVLITLAHKGQDDLQPMMVQTTCK
jgi:hypothetical protein